MRIVLFLLLLTSSYLVARHYGEIQHGVTSQQKSQQGSGGGEGHSSGNGAGGGGGGGF
jgi:uncharacterized membrane protein